MAKSRQNRTNSTKFYEIIEDVGPIPRGIYRSNYEQPEFVEFLTSKNVLFSIIGEWQVKVRSVTNSYAKKNLTSESNFLERYYDNLDALRKDPQPFRIGDPITTCMLDPSVARECQ